MNNFLFMLKESLFMFIELAAQLTVLFLVLSYIVGIVQFYLPPQKVQKILSNQKGYILAALLGAITPFCSATTIPFLKGLLRAKAGFGTVMVFLFASPLLNPMIMGLLFLAFGLKVVVLFFSVAMVVSIISGYILEKMGFEAQVKDKIFMVDESNVSCCSSSCSSSSKENMWLDIWNVTWFDFKSALPYLSLGVLVGSIVYGFVPTEFISEVAGKDNVFAVPVSAIIGIPLYITPEALIPLSSVLIDKGMGMGALMALIIGSAGASLTEVILLKSIFHNKLIVAFLIVVLGMAITAGYLYNILF